MNTKYELNSRTFTPTPHLPPLPQSHYPSVSKATKRFQPLKAPSVSVKEVKRLKGRKEGGNVKRRKKKSMGSKGRPSSPSIDQQRQNIKLTCLLLLLRPSARAFPRCDHDHQEQKRQLESIQQHFILCAGMLMVPQLTRGRKLM